MNFRRLSITLCGIILGGVFIYAALGKIPDPGEFEDLVKAYRFFPHFMLNPIAIILPWLELLCGILLVTGFMRRPAALIVLCLTVAFLFLLGWAMYHGYEISCGCFPTEEDHTVGWPDIWRDLLLIGMGLVCLLEPGGAKKQS